MRTDRLLAGYRVLLTLGAIASVGTPAFAAVPEFKKQGQGLISPFKLKGVSLADFAQGYSRFSGKSLEVGGTLEKVLKGSVTLLIPRPISEEGLTELFHQVLQEKGFAVVEGPNPGTWRIASSRDALDAIIPIFDSNQFPLSHRMMTVVHSLKHIDADRAIPILASHLPRNSRIVPQFRSQILITSDGLNIGKALEILKLMDTEEAEKHGRAVREKTGLGSQCSGPERKIEKLVVENMEIQNLSHGESSDPFSSENGGGK